MRDITMGHFVAQRRLLYMTRVGVPTTIEPRSNARLAAEGDEYAFARLISEHSSAMMRVAFVIAGDWSIAQDAVQSAWTLAWKKLPSVRDPTKLEAWLVSIAANETRTILRRTRRRMVVETHAGPEPTPGSDPDAAIDLVDLRNALRRLSPDDRSLVAMRYLSGFDATQIGAAMGISSSGVRSRLGRILERLRKDLEHG